MAPETHAQNICFRGYRIKNVEGSTNSEKSMIYRYSQEDVKIYIHRAWIDLKMLREGKNILLYLTRPTQLAAGALAGCSCNCTPPT